MIVGIYSTEQKKYFIFFQKGLNMADRSDMRATLVPCIRGPEIWVCVNSKCVCFYSGNLKAGRLIPHTHHSHQPLGSWAVSYLAPASMLCILRPAVDQASSLIDLLFPREHRGSIGRLSRALHQEFSYISHNLCEDSNTCSSLLCGGCESGAKCVALMRGGNWSV